MVNLPAAVLALSSNDARRFRSLHTPIRNRVLPENVEHFNVALPDSFALELIDYWNGLDVISIAVVQLGEDRLYSPIYHS